jgi:hypothetical protein
MHRPNMSTPRTRHTVAAYWMGFCHFDTLALTTPFARTFCRGFFCEFQKTSRNKFELENLAAYFAKLRTQFYCSIFFFFMFSRDFERGESIDSDDRIIFQTTRTLSKTMSRLSTERTPVVGTVAVSRAI